MFYSGANTKTISNFLNFKYSTVNNAVAREKRVLQGENILPKGRPSKLDLGDLNLIDAIVREGGDACTKLKNNEVGV